MRKEIGAALRGKVPERPEGDIRNRDYEDKCGGGVFGARRVPSEEHEEWRSKILKKGLP